jgi:hypothetical protein
MGSERFVIFVLIASVLPGLHVLVRLVNHVLVSLCSPLSDTNIFVSPFALILSCWHRLSLCGLIICKHIYDQNPIFMFIHMIKIQPLFCIWPALIMVCSFRCHQLYQRVHMIVVLIRFTLLRR